MCWELATVFLTEDGGNESRTGLAVGSGSGFGGDRRLAQDFLPSPTEPTSQPWLIRKQVPETTRTKLQQIARTFWTKTSDPRKLGTTSYLASSQQLYPWLVAPLVADLQANRIDTLVFCMDNGLRSLPLAALNDGQDFLVEKYNLALILSFSLSVFGTNDRVLSAVGIKRDEIGGPPPNSTSHAEG